MKLPLKPILASCLLIMSLQSSFALDIIPSDSGNYYELGGGSDITMPPVTRNEDITIGANANSNFERSAPPRLRLKFSVIIAILILKFVSFVVCNRAER